MIDCFRLLIQLVDHAKIAIIVAEASVMVIYAGAVFKLSRLPAVSSSWSRRIGMGNGGWWWPAHRAMTVRVTSA